MAALTILHLGFDPIHMQTAAEYISGEDLINAGIYANAILCLLLTIGLYYYGLFRPNCYRLCCTHYTSITARKYLNAGFHFLFLSLAWFVFAIQHHFHQSTEQSTAVQIVWSSLYHLAILFYFLSVGPPPHYTRKAIHKLEWLIFVTLTFVAIIASFVMDLFLLQSAFGYLLWFLANCYLFAWTIIDIYVNHVSSVLFYEHVSILFTFCAVIAAFVPIHCFKSSERLSSYAVVVVCLGMSSLAYFGALILESEAKNVYRSMSIFEPHHDSDDDDEDVELMASNIQLHHL